MDWEERIDELDEDQAGLVRILAGARSVRRSMPNPKFYYCGKEDFLLQNGEWFTVKPWSRKGYEGLPKYCYSHSALLCSVHRSLKYVEGVASLDGEIALPIDHAWVTTAKGELIDGTWRNAGKAYLGVQFPLKMIIFAMEHNYTVLCNPSDYFALYRKVWVPRKKSLKTGGQNEPNVEHAAVRDPESEARSVEIRGTAISGAVRRCLAQTEDVGDDPQSSIS